VQFAVVEFVEFSRPAGPLLFDRKAMLTSAGVFFAKEPQPTRHDKLYFNFTFKYLLNCH
jgi:hypothetical protein